MGPLAGMVCAVIPSACRTLDGGFVNGTVNLKEQQNFSISYGQGIATKLSHIDQYGNCPYLINYKNIWNFFP